MTDSRTDSDALQLLLDGRLDPVTRTAVEQRLRDDVGYRAQFAALRALRETLRATQRAALPADLWSRIEGNLTEETGHNAPEAAPGKLLARGGWRQWRLAALVLLCFVPAALIVQRMAGRAVVTVPVAVDDVTRATSEYDAGRLPLEQLGVAPSALQAHFRARGLQFDARVLDLQMMGYTLVGGRRHEIGGQPSALFVYQGPAGERLLCQMFVADLQSVSRGAERREHSGITFYVHRRGPITAVFWAEGEVLCALSSTADAESVIALAMAKAMA